MSKALFSIPMLLILSAPFLLLHSCRKLVEVEPPVTNPTDITVFEKNSTAAAILTGIYSRMIVGDAMCSGTRSISFLSGLSADELQNYAANPMMVQFYTNSVDKTSVPFWSESYEYIYTANAAIDGLFHSSGVTQPMKQQLLGEAYFIRAFCYFYLVNLFGDVPLHISTDFKVNAVASRSPQASIYQQIIADLTEAQNLLTDDYLAADNTTTSERIRPNKAAATALLARAYLYSKEYAAAEAQSSAIIDNAATYELEPDLNQVFLKNSREAIWQLSPVQPQYNTYDGFYFILRGAPGFNQPVALSTYLLDAFEQGDSRRETWVDSISEGGSTFYYPFKYKVGELDQPISEYLMVLRLGEQYLIRAEARANLGNIQGSLNDLNTIRQRAGLDGTAVSDKPSLLLAIERERKVELFTEWGHRWLDLKRTGKVDVVMSAVTPSKGGVWSPNWQWYPVPQSEIQNNPNISQNAGY